MHPLFETGLFGQLKEQANFLWKAYTEHDFVKQLASGKLPEKCFKRFLTQDYLFLIHFSRAYALLAVKSTQLNDMEDALKGLKAIANELPLHIKYCEAWGMTKDDIQNETEASQTIAYTRFVLDTGLIGDRLELLTALMPCIVGYAEIGITLARSKDTIFENNPYANWIMSYESPQFFEGVEAAIKMFNRLDKDFGANQRFAHLSKIFNTATRLEIDFWQMGLKAH